MCYSRLIGPMRQIVIYEKVVLAIIVVSAPFKLVLSSSLIRREAAVVNLKITHDYNSNILPYLTRKH